MNSLHILSDVERLHGTATGCRENVGNLCKNVVKWRNMEAPKDYGNSILEGNSKICRL